MLTKIIRLDPLNFSIDQIQEAIDLIRKDEIVRLYFQPTAYNDIEQTRHFMFGSGPHACLGRQIAVMIWRGLAACLKADTRRFEVVDFALTRSRLFIIPDRFAVRIST